MNFCFHECAVMTRGVPALRCGQATDSWRARTPSSWSRVLSPLRTSQQVIDASIQQAT